MNLKLRTRIALLYVVSTGLLVGSLFVAIYSIAAHTMDNHFDDALLAEYEEVTSSMAIENGKVNVFGSNEWTEQEHGQAETSPVFLEAVDCSGRTVLRSANLRDLHLHFDSSQRAITYLNAVLGTADVRQVQGPVYGIADSVSGYLIVAEGRSNADELLRHLQLVMLISFPIVIGVIFGVSVMFGGQIVAPVNTIITTAERITKENLDDRIPLPVRHDELYRMTATINKLLERLQDALLREQQFTADAAHELRTPLATLKGTLEVLIRHPREPHQYVEKVTYCLGEVNRVSAMVEQLLFLARYESGAIKPSTESVELVALIGRVLHRLDPLITRKEIVVTTQSPKRAVVTGDAMMIEIILENIVSNAVKYSTLGQPLEIEIGVDAFSTRCTVTDHGVGMTDDQLQKVFHRFYRSGEPRTSQISGFGLGLALVRRMADLQGIDVTAISQPSQGSSFTVHFPDTPSAPLA